MEMLQLKDLPEESLCPSREISQGPPGSRYPMQKQETLLPSSSWGSHHYQRSGYREEPWVLDYIAYIGSVHGKKGFLGRGMSDWSLSFEGLCVGS